MPTVLDYIVYPLLVACIIGGVTLFFRDRKSIRDKIDKLNSRMSWLIGNPDVKNDNGKVGEIMEVQEQVVKKLDTIIRQTK